MSVTQLDEDPEERLLRRLREEVLDAITKPDLSAVHEVIRAAGIRSARSALAAAPDRLAQAQAAYREAQSAEALITETHTTALLEAEWLAAGEIHRDGNKQYRWVNCGEHDGAAPTPLCTECNGSGKVRLVMLADDIARWKAAEAAKVPDVMLLAAELRRAEGETAAARDAVLVAEKRMSAQRSDLEAAVAELNALAIGLSAKGA